MGYKIRTRETKSREPVEQIDRFSLTEWVGRYRPVVLSVCGVGGVLLIVILVLFFLHLQQETRSRALAYEALRYLSGEGSSPKDLQKAGELYRKIREEYPKSSVAPLASYYLGNLSFESKEYDQAIAFYTEFLDRYAERKKEFLPLIYLRLGYSYEAKGEGSEALKAFKMVSDLSGFRLKDQASYEMGRVYEEMDVKAEAIAQYESVMAQFVGSPWAAEAQARLQKLRPFPPTGGPGRADTAPESTGKRPEPLGPAFSIRPDHTREQ